MKIDKFLRIEVSCNDVVYQRELVYIKIILFSFKNNINVIISSIDIRQLWSTIFERLYRTKVITFILYNFESWID